MTGIEDTRTVAVLGLGNMGSALAEALLSAGCSVTVWNRTPGKSARLAERGATTANSAVEAIQAAEIVIGRRRQDDFGLDDASGAAADGAVTNRVG